MRREMKSGKASCTQGPVISTLSIMLSSPPDRDEWVELSMSSLGNEIRIRAVSKGKVGIAGMGKLESKSKAMEQQDSR